MRRCERHLMTMTMGCVLVWTLVTGWCTAAQPLRLGPYGREQQAPAPSGPPAIIWFHAVKTNSLESLRLALDSRLPNHVMVSYMHRRDAVWEESDEALKAIEMVRRSGARLIWCRDLWPYYKNQGIGLQSLRDPNYYVQEVRALRAEAQAMKADGVALDVEPYGHSPIKPWFKSGGGLSQRELTAMRAAIQAALEEVGQVEFVLPAGSLRKDHPYNLLSSLGERRISESTYYQEAGAVRPVPYPYEIFGAHVSSRKWSFAPAGRACFLIQELLDRSQVWSDKQGLFLYASGPDCLKVAKDLRDYAKALCQRQEARSKK